MLSERDACTARRPRGGSGWHPSCWRWQDISRAEDHQMYRTIFLAAAIASAVLQGCAASPRSARADSNVTGSDVNHDSASASQNGSKAEPSIHVAQVTEVPVEPNAPDVAGHPMTSVVVTRNLIVAVYMTMPDGRLLRF